MAKARTFSALSPPLCIMLKSRHGATCARCRITAISRAPILAWALNAASGQAIMNISDLLAPDAIIPLLKVQSKKQLMQELAARAHALTNIPERRIFETLIERERLGTTGVGSGIAIPHG